MSALEVFEGHCLLSANGLGSETYRVVLSTALPL